MVRVQDGPIGLLVRWLVVRAELHDVSEKRLVVFFCPLPHVLLFLVLPFVHANERRDDGVIDAPGEEQIGND